jgi:hypothetical protein
MSAIEQNFNPSLVDVKGKTQQDVFSHFFSFQPIPPPLFLKRLYFIIIILCVCVTTLRLCYSPSLMAQRRFGRIVRYEKKLWPKPIYHWMIQINKMPVVNVTNWRFLSIRSVCCARAIMMQTKMTHEDFYNLSPLPLFLWTITQINIVFNIIWQQTI